MILRVRSGFLDPERRFLLFVSRLNVKGPKRFCTNRERRR